MRAKIILNQKNREIRDFPFSNGEISSFQIEKETIALRITKKVS